MRRIGLHLRYKNSWAELGARARALEIPHFQCFLPQAEEFSVLSEDVRECLGGFGELYAHGSYRINYASRNHIHYLLKHELDMISKLGFTHYVLHPGAYEQGSSLEEGIDHVVRVVNSIHKKYPDLTILIENTAYDGRTIGFELSHLARIYQKIEKSERVGICLDSAHAFVSGYDLVANMTGFFDELVSLFSLDAIKLLHISDTANACGSFSDMHCMIGAGRLGERVLRDFVYHNRFAHVPVVIELPHATEDDEVIALNMVRSWGA